MYCDREEGKYWQFEEDKVRQTDFCDGTVGGWWGGEAEQEVDEEMWDRRNQITAVTILGWSSQQSLQARAVLANNPRSLFSLNRKEQSKIVFWAKHFKRTSPCVEFNELSEESIIWSDIPMLSHLETQEGSAAALLSWGNTKTWDVYFAARLSDWCTIEAKDSHGGNALMNNYFLAPGSKIATKCNISVHFSCTVAWKVPTVKEILQMLKEKGLRMGCTRCC